MGTMDGAICRPRYIYNLHYHLLWTTKNTAPLLRGYDLQHDLRGYLTKIAQRHDVLIERLVITDSMVNLYLSFPPRVTIVSLIKTLKSQTAQALLKYHQEIKTISPWTGHVWAPHYYLGSLGAEPNDLAEKYFASQVQ